MVVVKAALSSLVKNTKARMRLYFSLDNKTYDCSVDGENKDLLNT